MKRRTFVVSTGLSFLGLAAGCVPKDGPVEPAGDSPNTPAESPTPDSDACPATHQDIEGPYYREGVPVRSNLDLYDHEGDPLLLSGTVTDSTCTPIPNAVVEIWHADPDGAYDTTSDEKRYYGQVATDADGAYAFTTLMPGRYLNGSEYRPAHVHIKVHVGGVEELTSQIYFDGDPYNEIDGWYDPARSVSVGADGSATFDVAV